MVVRDSALAVQGKIVLGGKYYTVFSLNLYTHEIS
jgi:hypothetical protein